jgi:hypothetical protein
LLCKYFSQGGQCWNRNCDCLLLCLTFFTPIIWGFCCWPGLCLTYNHHIGHWRSIMRIIWVFHTGCQAPGSTRNDWGTSYPCLFPPMAVKSKPPALRVVVDTGNPTTYLYNYHANFAHFQNYNVFKSLLIYQYFG